MLDWSDNFLFGIKPGICANFLDIVAGMDTERQHLGSGRGPWAEIRAFFEARKDN